MRSGQENLATRMAQHLEKPAISAPVELARYVVQQEDRHPAGALAQQVELCGLECEDDGPMLSLRAVVTRSDFV
jgi:hypothetical protein